MVAKGLEQTLFFLRREGHRIIQIWMAHNGACMCGKGAECKSPGKHPVEGGWQKKARSASEACPSIGAAFAGKANYGIALGPTDVVLDFDGAEGKATLDYLESILPKIATGPRVRTQSGGWHVYARLASEGGIRNGVRLLPGMDVRTTKGFVVGPGSTGVAGVYTLFNHDAQVPLLEEPDLHLLLLASSLKVPADRMQKTSEGSRNDRLFRATCSVRARNAGLKYLVEVALGLNAWNSPPLDGDEVRNIARSAAGYQYSATTSSEPAALGTAEQACDEILPKAVDLLRTHPSLVGSVGLDRLSGMASWLKDPPFQSRTAVGKALTQVDLDRLRDLATRHLQDAVSMENLHTAVRIIAEENHFHPIEAYLAGLSWDSKPRVESFLALYFGANDDGYSRFVSRSLLVSMVARVFEPGAKVDTVPILEGPQGINKSLGLRALGGIWFGDPSLDLTNKDSVMQCQGLWLVEFAELTALKGRSAEAAKAFITTQVDRIRPPYARLIEDFPRQFVIVGTTNEEKYLHDPTGNRRYLPVKVSRVDVAAISDDRDQLFAEAVALYRAGVEWWASDEVSALCAQEQADRVESHPWEDALNIHLKSPQRPIDMAPALELFEHLKIPQSQLDRSKTTQLGQIMKKLGFNRTKLNGATVYRRASARKSTSNLANLNQGNLGSASRPTETLPWPQPRVSWLRKDVPQVGRFNEGLVEPASSLPSRAEVTGEEA